MIELKQHSNETGLNWEINLFVGSEGTLEFGVKASISQKEEEKGVVATLATASFGRNDICNLIMSLEYMLKYYDSAKGLDRT